MTKQNEKKNPLCELKYRRQILKWLRLGAELRKISGISVVDVHLPAFRFGKHGAKRGHGLKPRSVFFSRKCEKRGLDFKS
jgi:hypothetical protein